MSAGRDDNKTNIYSYKNTFSEVSLFKYFEIILDHGGFDKALISSLADLMIMRVLVADYQCNGHGLILFFI